MMLEKFSIRGELVAITGGAGLLGAMHAEAVAEVGGIPIILDISEKKAQAVVDGIQDKYSCAAQKHIVDITCENDLKNVVEKIATDGGKPVYGLINNASIDPKFDKDESKTPKSRLEEFPLAQWNLELAVGLTGAFLCIKHFGAEMARARKGVIVNISSDLGIISPDQRIYRKPGHPDDLQDVKPVTYSAIKHGLIGLTKYVATYWADKGVRCNALAPGGVYNEHPDEFLKQLTNLIPLGRMASRDEYQSAIQFLMSDASSYMNGAVLVMDGGRSVW
jgi:NAD(P)-dependent dehydrogenase (short-subunit alcohol dehydrogenase family)